MSRRLLALILAIVIVAVVILLYYLLVVLPSQKVTSQALAVTSIPSSPSPAPAPVTPPPIPVGIPFAVHSGSFLANFAGQQIIVAAQPMFIGDSVWLLFQLSNGVYVNEVMNVVAAENIGVGTSIVKGSIITPVLA